MTKTNVIFALGAPGSGKGTQCDRIAQNYDYVHLSVGEILRKEADKPGSTISSELNDSMKQGSLASSGIACKLIDNAMKENDGKNFLIDGFPRDKENIDEWKKTIGDRVQIQCVFVFNCDEKTSLNRCLERGKKAGRKDDNEENIKKRIGMYHESTEPVIKLYEKENLVQHIDASKDADKIFQAVENVMKNLDDKHHHLI